MSACSDCGNRHEGYCFGSPEHRAEQMDEIMDLLRVIKDDEPKAMELYRRGRKDGMLVALEGARLFVSGLRSGQKHVLSDAGIVACEALVEVLEACAKRIDE